MTPSPETDVLLKYGYFKKIIHLKFIFCNENKNNIGLPIDFRQVEINALR